MSLPIFEFKSAEERSLEVGEERAQELTNASNFCFFLNGLIDQADIRRFLTAQPLDRVLHIASIFKLETLPEDGKKSSLIEMIIDMVTSPQFTKEDL